MKISRYEMILMNCWILEDAIVDEPDALFRLYEYYDVVEKLYIYKIEDMASDNENLIFEAPDRFTKDQIISYCNQHDIFTETYFYL